MSSDLSNQISAAMKSALKAHDSTRLNTLRLLYAAIKQKAVDDRQQPGDEDIQAIIEKQVRQRRESIAAFEAAGRSEKAAEEASELAILQEFLPEQASTEDIRQAIDEAFAQIGDGSSSAAMGAIMGALKKKLAGRADMSQVAAMVKQRLND